MTAAQLKTLEIYKIKRLHFWYYCIILYVVITGSEGGNIDGRNNVYNQLDAKITVN